MAEITHNFFYSFIFFRFFWGAGVLHWILKDLLLCLGNTHCIIGYSQDSNSDVNYRTHTTPKNAKNYCFQRFGHVFMNLFDFALDLVVLARAYFKTLLQSFSPPEPTTKRWLNVRLHPLTLLGGRNRHLILPVARYSYCPYCKRT